MHGKGKIDDGRIFGQYKGITPGGECDNFSGKENAFEFGHQVMGGVGAIVPIDKIVQPAHAPLFVLCVSAQCGDAKFAQAMHCRGLNVEFVALISVVDAGVEGLISIAFGQGYKVFETLHNGQEVLVQNAQSQITQATTRDNDFDRVAILNLIEGTMLHFAVNAT